MGLPFNYYLSTLQKIRSSLGFFLQWKISLPIVLCFSCFITWTTLTIKEGRLLVNFIKEHDPQTILQNELISKNINSKPFVIGKSLMYYVVQRQNPELIDHFLQKGADPGRTLIYLSETRNFDLFRAYYPNLAQNISQDEYYLVLLRSADTNFTEGYRYLVNSPRFDTLNPDYKADLARDHKPSRKTRLPASSVNE